MSSLRFCRSGLHPWRDEENRKRCCCGYKRVHADSRKELEDQKCEHITLSGVWSGWLKMGRKK